MGIMIVLLGQKQVNKGQWGLFVVIIVYKSVVKDIRELKQVRTTTTLKKQSKF